MTLHSFLLVLASVTLSALGQTAFKIGVGRAEFAAGATALAKATAMVLSPYVLAGLAAYGLGTVLWLFALRQLDLSLAYPFVAMSFVMIVFSGVVFLGEPLQMSRLAGTGLIVLGLVVMARGA